MKKNSSGLARASRVSPQVFEPRLRAYSGLSASVILTTGGVVIGTTATASGQILTLDASYIGTNLGSTHLPASTYGTLQVRLRGAFAGQTFSFALRSQDLTFQVHSHPGSVVVFGGQPGRFGSGFAVQAGPFGANGNLLFGGGNLGNFATNGSHSVAGYLGVRLPQNGAFYYGWLRIKVTGDDNGNPVSLDLVTDTGGVFGALNTIPNQGILTGQTLAAIPEPSTVAAGLALFALGAAGVREHRRRRARAA